LTIRYTKPAARRLDAILAYLEARSPQGAGHVLDEIDAALALVAERRPPLRRRAVRGN